jgi:endonuclease YncB( thermonuclease family)
MGATAAAGDGPRSPTATAESTSPSALDRMVARFEALYGPLGWIDGMVVGVIDGDTVDVKVNERRMERVRLVEIDAPERGAPYSKQSKQVLSELVYGRMVSVAITSWDSDRDGRPIGRILRFSDDRARVVDVSREMVARGAAWYFPRFGKDRSLVAVQSAAQSARLGLWALPVEQQMPPWEWRKAPRDARPAQQASKPTEGSLHVNVNTATPAELESLPGIGPALAQRIIAGRPYKSMGQLERFNRTGRTPSSARPPRAWSARGPRRLRRAHQLRQRAIDGFTGRKSGGDFRVEQHDVRSTGDTRRVLTARQPTREVRALVCGTEPIATR